MATPLQINFKLCLDSRSGRVVHIDQVPEGFELGICPDCNSPLIASNRNKVTRVKDTYFRHKSDSKCSGETLVHMWAKQIIIDSKKVMGAAILAVGEAKDLKGKIHRSERNQPNKWLHFSSVMPEKPLTKDGSYRIPDLICLLTDGTQRAIEIFVNNAVSEEKASFFNSLKLDCLEIDLSCLTDKDFNSHSEFEEQVLYEAPRQWIFSSFYASQVKKAQKEAQEKAAAANERIRSDREENRNFKATWRQANSEFISLIEAYMVPSNRLKVSSLYESQLLQMGTLSNSYKAWFDQHLSGNPEIINIPVRGELGFNCHRSAWQWEVYMRAVLQSF